MGGLRGGKASVLMSRRLRKGWGLSKEAVWGGSERGYPPFGTGAI
jgi:hypothetical protein